MNSYTYDIVLASDHAGFELKELIKKELEKKFTTKDLGTFSSESMDYPDVAHLLAQAVQDKKAEKGIILCGSGNGVCMTVNKHKDIRGALCWDEDITKLARLHNDANVLCIPARFISVPKALTMVNVFLNTPFEGERHQKRVDKI